VLGMLTAVLLDVFWLSKARERSRADTTVEAKPQPATSRQ
jgi:hypothetical protein